MERLVGWVNNWRADKSTQESVADQALRWFVRLRSGEATACELLQFQSWIKADPAHSLEFRRLSRLWGDLEEIKPLLADELNRLVVDARPQPSRAGERYAGGWAAYGFTAAVAACLAVLIAGWGGIFDYSESAEYHTAKGEQRTVVFADGSKMVLNTDTAVTAQESASRRVVTLHRGEAFFDVIHGRKKTFEVVAGGGVVRDIGTQFDVRRQPGQVSVAVVQGTVEVLSSLDQRGAEPWQLLKTGQRVSYGEGGSLTSIETIDPDVLTAWLQGRLIFDRRPLAEVIQEVGRYQRGEIRVLESRLNDLTVSGVFAVRDREGFLNALAAAMPVRVTRVNEEVAILEGKKNISQER